MRALITLCLGISLSLSGLSEAASAVARNEEGAGKNQRFRYDPEASFTIVGFPGVPTDIQLANDEHVSGFALGDTVQWVIEELPGHLFIKPMRADLFTAGTLVTDRHTYQLTFKSTNSKENWMQRVSWSYPDLVILRSADAVIPHGAERIPYDLNASQIKNNGDIHSVAEQKGLDPSKLYLDYQVKGEAPFRPLALFDDGRSLWLKMQAHQPLPAVFEDTEEGAKLLHFAVRDDWIVIPRLVPKITLKLGTSELHIVRKNSEEPHGFFGK